MNLGELIVSPSGKFFLDMNGEAIAVGDIIGAIGNSDFEVIGYDLEKGRWGSSDNWMILLKRVKIGNEDSITMDKNEHKIGWYISKKVARLGENQVENTAICKDCGVPMRWVSMALKCPKCWKVI